MPTHQSIAIHGYIEGIILNNEMRKSTQRIADFPTVTSHRVAAASSRLVQRDAEPEQLQRLRDVPEPGRQVHVRMQRGLHGRRIRMSLL
jgi:hypothetical protein